MKRTLILSMIAGVALSATAGLVGAQSVEALRNGEIAEALPPAETFHIDEGRTLRNYRQQPPLIPHDIAKYQINTNANQCLSCHDWSVAAERNAPTLSMTHYQDRDGNQLNQVAGGRWFCNQCHVPQADAPELVRNTFEAAARK